MSYISQQTQTHIRAKLENLAREHRVRILIAVESGSRAWGFPSADSDYDVRFIYIHTQNEYLGIQDIRDVIETPTAPDNILGTVMDMNGWDLRKALQLSLKSNAVVQEWLTSPIHYIIDEAAITSFKKFVSKTASLPSYIYHYDHLARNAYEKICADSQKARLKDYCYAIRAALALRWIESRQDLPPMDINSLQNGLIVNKEIQSEISNIITLKKTATEADTIPRKTILDDLIVETLSCKREKPLKKEKDDSNIIFANSLFREILLQSQ